MLCALLVRCFDMDLPVQGYPVPAGDLLRVVYHIVGGEVLDVRDAFVRLHLLQAGDDVEDSGGDVVPSECLHFFSGEEIVRHLDWDGFSALLLDVEALRGPVPVHQGSAFIGQDHLLAVRVGGGNHPVEGAAHVLDGCGSALLHRDRRAELTEPDGPVRALRGIEDRHRMDGFSALCIRTPFGPYYAAGGGTRSA